MRNNLRRIILSRKGFDSASGRCPSPIYPDGTILSIPIPGDYEPGHGVGFTRFEDLGMQGSLRLPRALRTSLRKSIPIAGHVHLDPDIRPDLRPKTASRKSDKLLLFGQCDAAQRHLDNQGVSEGDLFLFFGLFRRADPDGDGAEFVRSSRQKHVIWGWLQVGKVHRLVADNVPGELRWATHHPHFQFRERANNCIYEATRELTVTRGLNGAGIFETYDDALCLTTQEATLCSDWTLPAFFKQANTTYLRTNEWKRVGSVVRGRSPGRGQEFVAQIEGVEDQAIKWLKSIFKHAKRTR